jgi:hypothetical protein
MMYRDLVGDTVGAMTNMYAHFGIPFSATGRAGTEQYLKGHPREARPVHKVDMSDVSTKKANA